MSLLVTGSIGIDTVKTPHGLSENCLGGSSVYFSMAASFFAPVRFVGVVGDDVLGRLLVLLVEVRMEILLIQAVHGAGLLVQELSLHKDMVRHGQLATHGLEEFTDSTMELI